MKLSPLSRFLLRHCAIGMVTGLVFVGALLLFDVGGLHTLVRQSDVGGFAVFLLAVLVSSTFASAQMGFAIMLNGR